MIGMTDNVLGFMVLRLPEKVQRLIDEGRFKEAERELMSLASRVVGDYRRRLLFEVNRLERWRYEYAYGIDEAYEKLKEKMPDLSREEFVKWSEKGCIDYRVIEGEKRFLRRFVPNFFWLCPEARNRRVEKKDEERERAKAKLKERVERIIEAARDKPGHVLPLYYRVRMEIEVKPGVVPVGEVLRVWVPIPRVDKINPSVNILASDPKPVKIAEEDHPQRTIYFELEITEKGARCWVEYEFTSMGFYVEVDPKNVGEIDKDDPVYIAYTAERPPHIVFTPYLKDLARRIVGDEENPYLKAKKIWDWITNNVRYTYAHDYALYDNISEYVAKNRRGDCGMQALLFITLCRIVGVPARWQSSWYMNPVRHGMHDWAQFYVEPYGWLYADPSFGNMRHGEEWRNKFYFGGIDGYRMAANIEVSAQFDPPKTHFRSDPVDSQRGEIEWRGGNLYYDKWEYKYSILKFEEK